MTMRPMISSGNPAINAGLPGWLSLFLRDFQAICSLIFSQTGFLLTKVMIFKDI
ncbi:hypothetical protein [Methylovorus sp. MP688]|uniref:hypothetical protein n=1 Tax=Methylovorus sp. (strain MP688) TaxID=887061 RepID=UPI001439F89B|nr:hypothetical protein [Methylovorus sp. MP688]